MQALEFKLYEMNSVVSEYKIFKKYYLRCD